MSTEHRARARGSRLSRSSLRGGTLLAVVSGAAGLGTAHRLLAALVAPPLAALLVSAWLAHRRLVPAVLAAAALFAAAAARPGPHAHAALAALRARGAPSSSAVQSFRGERVPWGSWRDYVALTKPRIMSLLLVTGFCGMIAGARGWPGTSLAVAAMVGLALACGGASALNHVLDRDIDPLMGERTKRAAGRVRPRARRAARSSSGSRSRRSRSSCSRARSTCSPRCSRSSAISSTSSSTRAG